MPGLDLGLAKKLTPLIDFKALFDEDVGVCLLALKEYKNPKYFDLSHREMPQFINKIYFRKEHNPLYTIAKEDADKSFLDECYEEMKEKEKDKITDLSLGTDMLNLVRLFKNSGEVNPSILYHNDMELKVLEEESILNGIDKISFSEYVNSDLSKRHSQFYFHKIEDCLEFPDMVFKTIYFSTCGVNCDDGDLKINNIIDVLTNLNNQISMFDMYNRSVIGGDTSND